MAAYLTSAFGERQQAAELAESSNRIWVAEAAETSEIVGYAHVRLESAPPTVPTSTPAAEVARLYVDRRWHGAGIARALMDACVRSARDAGAGLLWLGVWERNPRAIAFYRKCGFEPAGTQQFTLGDDVQTDLVMAKALGGADA